MIDKTNDPALRAYIEHKRAMRRQEAARGGSYNPYKPIAPGATLKVPKIKSAEIPGETAETPEIGAEANKINILLVQELKNINNNLHLIQRELKNINKTLDRRK